MASETPAKLIGIPDKGKIQAGYDAEFIVLSDDYNIKMTVINGEIIA